MLFSQSTVSKLINIKNTYQKIHKIKQKIMFFLYFIFCFEMYLLIKKKNKVLKKYNYYRRSHDVPIRPHVVLFHSLPIIFYLPPILCNILWHDGIPCSKDTLERNMMEGSVNWGPFAPHGITLHQCLKLPVVQNRLSFPL